MVELLKYRYYRYNLCRRWYPFSNCEILVNNGIWRVKEWNPRYYWNILDDKDILDDYGDDAWAIRLSESIKRQRNDVMDRYYSKIMWHDAIAKGSAYWEKEYKSDFDDDKEVWISLSEFRRTGGC